MLKAPRLRFKGNATAAEKLRIVEETLCDGESISAVARRNGEAPNLLYRWRKLMLEGGCRRGFRCGLTVWSGIGERQFVLPCSANAVPVSLYGQRVVARYLVLDCQQDRFR